MIPPIDILAVAAQRERAAFAEYTKHIYDLTPREKWVLAQADLDAARAFAREINGENDCFWGRRFSQCLGRSRIEEGSDCDKRRYSSPRTGMFSVRRIQTIA
jgi:hypothetical protein